MKPVAFLLSLFITFAATAEEYRDAFRRFTITPPAGWVKVSDADVKKFDDFVAGRMKDRNFHYIAAFTKDPKKPLEPP